MSTRLHHSTLSNNHLNTDRNLEPVLQTGAAVLARDMNNTITCIYRAMINAITQRLYLVSTVEEA